MKKEREREREREKGLWQFEWIDGCLNMSKLFQFPGICKSLKILSKLFCRMQETTAQRMKTLSQKVHNLWVMQRKGVQYFRIAERSRACVCSGFVVWVPVRNPAWGLFFRLDGELSGSHIVYFNMW